MDHGVSVETGNQPNCPQDLFFVSDLETRLLRGGKYPGLTASERGKHSARQEDIHRSHPVCRSAAC